MADLDPSALQALIDALNRSTEAADARAKADEDAAKKRKEATEADKKDNKAKAEATAALNKIVTTGKAVAREFMSIADAGAKLSSTLGVTLTQGTQLELKNRVALLGQLFRVQIDQMATMQQIQSTQKSFVDVLGGAREGMQISAEGATRFANRLKEASGGSFTMTAAAMQAMITAGIGTANGLEQVRRSTGLRNLSEQRFTQLVNKNSLSFMLYGPRFAKAAQEAEKLGISLASVQAAQESMVTNLDGTIDTVAQINQLGGQIDFGTLTQLNEMQGPEATLKYLQSTIPPALFQSASTRALLKGFGISVEDLMKGQQSTQKSAADTIEAQLTELQEPIGTIAKAMALLHSVIEKLKNSFGPLVMAIAGFGVALLSISKVNMAAITKMFPLIGKFSGATKMGPLTAAETAAAASRAAFMRVGPIAALLSGIGGFTAAKREGADTKTALATGSVRSVSTLLGAGVGSFLIPLIGPLGPMLGGIIGAMLGDLFSRFIPKSIINSVASLFGDIAKVFMGWVDSIKEVFGAIKNLFAAITSENSKLAPVLKVVGTILGGVVGGIITIIGGIIDVILRLATALMKAGAFVINKLASWIGGTPTSPSTTTGNDVISRSGYGDRTLVTPNGSIALNNKDTVVAFADDMVSGIRTLSLGSISKEMSNTGGDSALIGKINELISVLQNSKTVINIDNKAEEVPRSNLVGVYVRNERRV